MELNSLTLSTCQDQILLPSLTKVLFKTGVFKHVWPPFENKGLDFSTLDSSTLEAICIGRRKCSLCLSLASKDMVHSSESDEAQQQGFHHLVAWSSCPNAPSQLAFHLDPHKDNGKKNLCTKKNLLYKGFSISRRLLPGTTCTYRFHFFNVYIDQQWSRPQILSTKF